MKEQIKKDRDFFVSEVAVAFCVERHLVASIASDMAGEEIAEQLPVTIAQMVESGNW